MVVRLAALVIVILAAGRAPAQEATPPPRWGTLQGRVVFRGEVPEPAVIADPFRKVPVPVRAGVVVRGPLVRGIQDHEFLAEHRGVIRSERLLVHRATRGVRDAIVCLVKPTAVSEAARAASPRVVNFRADRGVFVPHVLAFQRGAQVLVSSDDPISDHVYGMFPGAAITTVHSGVVGVHDLGER